MHGQFVWYELTTPDPDASIKFYPKFTNWGTQAFDKDYTMFTSGGAPVAGIFRQTPEMKAQGVPPNWMPYVEVSDVDASAAKAKSLGATVMVGPDDIPGTGRFAVIQDPQGAVLGLYKSSGPSNGWDGTNVIGQFSWHELMTTDHRKAAEFYKSLFGWEKINESDMGDGLMYLIFGLNGKMYGGMFTTPKEMAGMHPFWLCYIHVKDVGKAVQIATKNGASIHRPQMDIPGGSIAILGDPQGAGYAVHHAAAAPAPSAASQAAAATSKAVKKVSAAATKAVKTVAKRVAKQLTKKKAKPAKKKAARKPVRKAAKPARKAAKPARKAKPAKKKAPARRPARKKGGAKKKK
jgi:uncharacterized protein